MSRNTDDESESEYKSIPLKCCTLDDTLDKRFHIMKFQSNKSIDLANFNKPVTLHRKDPRNLQFHLSRKEIEEKGLNLLQTPIDFIDPLEMDLSQVAPDGGARKQKSSLFKRKTRQINLMDDSKRKLRYEEYYPWILEDYNGSNIHVSNYEAGSSDSQQVLFVFDSNGFKMIPTEKVYKFTQRNKYATLTLEEAEAKMEKNSAVPRWLMKKLEDNSSLDIRYTKIKTVANSQPDKDSDHDDLDFDEEFADDEEAPIIDGDDEELKFSEKKIKKEMLRATVGDDQDSDIDDLFENRIVDKEGKKLKKSLTKSEGAVYDSDDDIQNPYLSKSDLESDSSSDFDVVLPNDNLLSRSIFSHNLGNGLVCFKAPSQFLKSFPPGNWSNNGRKLPTLAQATQPKSPTPIIESDLSDDLVTVQDVLDLVKDNPLTTKELLLSLRSKVSANKDNKQRIISIVKQNLKLVDGKLVPRE